MIPHHLAGVLNIMTDIILCAFKLGQFFLASQHGLVPYFNEHFPLMQNKSWTECHVPKDLVSCVIACLCGKLQPMPSLLRQTPRARNTEITGQTTQQPRVINPFLDKSVPPDEREIITGAFSAWVRTGSYRRGNQINGLVDGCESIWDA